MSDTMTNSTATAATCVADAVLSPQQVEFFDTFGFIKLPGLFKAEIDTLIKGFDEAFATRTPDKVIKEDPLQETDNPVFKDRKRVILYHLVEQSDKLRWLASDPRVLGIVKSLIGENYEARPTDGHVFDCDTSWHPDMGVDSRYRIKLSFYLDPQRADSGAIRLIPGSNHESPYAKTLLQNLYGSPQKIRNNYGVEADQIPSWTVETDPGDVICWNFRTFHATFHGFEGRRLFSMTYCRVS
jgi:ectoine hydroxylase-related dioxygenase (phytanoyl-CoA dioxygenase family)